MYSAVSLTLALVALASAQIIDPMVREDLDPARWPNAKCNDGTQANYFHQDVSPDEALQYPGYIIYLQGGGLCTSEEECRVRCLGGVNPLCTASRTARMAHGNGIRSDDEDVNPYFHNYYQVYVPYCSSDVYVGNRDKDPDNDFDWNFRGFEIVHAVLESLKEVAHIDREGANVILTGTSAGGAGTGFTCPNMHDVFDFARLKCVADAAGIFPDIPCFGDDCETFQDYLMRGNEHWGGLLPADFNIFNYWVNGTNGIPMFVGIHHFDSWFTNAWGANQNNPDHMAEWEAGMDEMIDRIRRIRPDDFGMFVPKCSGHGMITSDNWYNSMRAGRYQQNYWQAIVNWVNPERTDDSHIAADQDWCVGRGCNDGC